MYISLFETAISLFETYISKHEIEILTRCEENFYGESEEVEHISSGLWVQRQNPRYVVLTNFHPKDVAQNNRPLKHICGANVS